MATPLSLYRTTIGKKVLMAVTGLILFGFAIVHMAGNLQFHLGHETMNDYAAKLRMFEIELLWPARIVLLLALLTHVWLAFETWRISAKARPISYAVRRFRAATFASRFMRPGGLFIFAFVVYHLMHLTLGLTGEYRMQGTSHIPDAYYNVVVGFTNPIIAGAYLASMLFLGLHLIHGSWSLFQTLGVSHPRWTAWLKRAMALLTAVVVLGFASVPIAVLAKQYDAKYVDAVKATPTTPASPVKASAEH